MGALAKALRRVNYLKDLANLLYQYDQQKKYSELAKQIQDLNFNFGDFFGRQEISPPSTQQLGDISQQEGFYRSVEKPQGALSKIFNLQRQITPEASVNKIIEEQSKAQTQLPSAPQTQPQIPTEQTLTQPQIPIEQTQTPPIDAENIAEKINQLFGKYQTDFNIYRQNLSKFIDSYNKMLSKILTSNIAPEYKNALVDLASKRFATMTNLFEIFKPKQPEISKFNVGEDTIFVTPQGSFYHQGNNTYDVVSANTITDAVGKYKVLLVLRDRKTNETFPRVIDPELKSPKVNDTLKGTTTDKEYEKLTQYSNKFFAFVDNIKRIFQNNPQISDLEFLNVSPDEIKKLKDFSSDNFIDAKNYLNNRTIGMSGNVPVTLGNLQIELDLKGKGKYTYGLISNELINNLITELGIKSKNQKIDIYNFFKEKTDLIDNAIKQKLGYQLDNVEKSLLTNYYYTYFLMNFNRFKDSIFKTLKQKNEPTGTSK